MQFSLPGPRSPVTFANRRSRPTVDPISFAQPKEIGERKGCPPAALILCLSASSGATCATQPGSQLITLATADFEQFAPLNPADVRCKAAAEGKVNQWWVVIPAKAGKRAKRVSSKRSAAAIQHIAYWIPAFAGMTGEVWGGTFRPLMPRRVAQFKPRAFDHRLFELRNGLYFA